MAAAREFDFFDSDSDTHELLVDEIRFLLTQQIDFLSNRCRMSESNWTVNNVFGQTASNLYG